MRYIDPYETYKTVLAMKTHFTQDSYDFIKYNGVVRASKETFSKRRDKYFFEKLSKKIKSPEKLVTFLVANMSENPKVWVGELCNQEAMDKYNEYKGKQEKLEYTFTNDLEVIFDYMEEHSVKMKNMIMDLDGEYPAMANLLISEKISKETFIILDNILNFLVKYDDIITDDIVWPDIEMKINKYKVFMDIDRDKFYNILKKRYNERFK